MTPAFALSLSENGITLLHQSDGEWFEIGSVTLDDPDFSDNLTELRKRAFALANDLSCIVVIPAEHVRYLTVPADDAGADDPTARIEAELAATTPYAASELLHDLQRRDGVLQVAAIARETVDEARRFTVQYGFVPLCFAAPPQGETWPGSFEFRFDDAPGHATAEPTSAATDLSAPLDGREPTEPEPAPAPPVEVTAAAPSVAIHPVADPDGAATFHPQNTLDGPMARSLWSVRHLRRAVPVTVVAVLAGVAFGILNRSGDAPGPEIPAPVVAEAPVPAQPDDQAPQTVASEIRPAEPVEQAATTGPGRAPVELPAVPAETDPEALADLASAPVETPDAPTSGPASIDAAVLDALTVAPSPVEQVQRDPESQEVFQEVTGLTIVAPDAPPTPPLEDPDELYLASIDSTDLSQDAIALPDVLSFASDAPVDQVSPPAAPGTRFALDARGLVTPTPEGTLNQDGVMVYLGRPARVPPAVPVRFETAPTATQADERLAGLRPKARPADLIDRFEREQLGGRSLTELASIRPKARPKSVQDRAQTDHTPTAQAVVRVPRPRARPSTVAALAAQRQKPGSAPLGSVASVKKSDDDDGSFQPKSVAPKIPSTASVARQATMDNAINLRRLNLIGVYGTPANRRALVRLPSGRYKKLKVGDRIDGGKVVAIGDSELRYQKKGRNLKLTMPKG
ncbi:hypothetical protein SAMN05444279_11117 [Ruegeria intermedia]|uniref:Type IV pilus biogenesis protein PilP n=1 Tax=Ruegeria intermedia TaxID=996115 RepID=A0A1M4X8Z6_9RHOB|nr:hypothetical protein [Ruegeria intermedia]SHE89964.1 hypothetical protein SAMN05444279_11117 [Ruegeria intermedia]